MTRKLQFIALEKLIHKGIRTNNYSMVQRAGNHAAARELFFAWNEPEGEIMLEDELYRYNPNETL